MKRLFPITMVILLFFARALPVMATETKEYVFEILPPISMLEEYDFLASADSTGVYEGRIPEGEYYIHWIGDSFYYYSETPVTVTYVYNAEAGINIASFQFNLVDEVRVNSMNGMIADFYDTEGVLYLALFFDSASVPIIFNDGSIIKFIPVNNTPSSEISDIIYADLFGSFLICGTLVGLALFRGNRYV